MKRSSTSVCKIFDPLDSDACSISSISSTSSKKSIESIPPLRTDFPQMHGCYNMSWDLGQRPLPSPNVRKYDDTNRITRMQPHRIRSRVVDDNDIPSRSYTDIYCHGGDHSIPYNKLLDKNVEAKDYSNLNNLSHLLDNLKYITKIEPTKRLVILCDIIKMHKTSVPHAGFAIYESIMDQSMNIDPCKMADLPYSDYDQYETNARDIAWYSLILKLYKKTCNELNVQPDLQKFNAQPKDQPGGKFAINI
jgi:hypothetical protein